VQPLSGPSSPSIVPPASIHADELLAMELQEKEQQKAARRQERLLRGLGGFPSDDGVVIDVPPRRSRSSRSGIEDPPPRYSSHRGSRHSHGQSPSHALGLPLELAMELGIVELSSRGGGGSNLRHRGMGISDREFAHMGYEELLALGERLGAVKNPGATANQISRLPIHTFYKSTASSSSSSSSGSTQSDAVGASEEKGCAICLETFGDGDRVTTLPCFHAFHSSEIDRWLSQKNVCPICKTSVGDD